MGLKKWLLRHKTVLLIDFKYPKRYPTCSIASYVPETIKIESNVIIKSGVTLSSSIKRIGEGVYIGNQSTILNVSEIGNYSCVSHNVKIGLDNHRLDAISTNPLFYDKSKGMVSQDNTLKELPTKIEADVLISADSVILSGITLGVGCVVGANSFVNKDIPPYAIVAGSPAKIIKYRFDEQIIKQLLQSEWWNKNLDELRKYAPYFNKPAEFLNHLK